jgi:hypothetical protein
MDKPNREQLIADIKQAILKYLEAYLKFHDLVAEKGKGDWNRAALLVKNDEQARQIYNDMDEALKSFRRLASEVGLAELPAAFISLCESMSERTDERHPQLRIALFLEHFREEWEWKIEEGHIEDGDLLDALDAFFALPEYDPDGWLKRRFLIGGLLLVREVRGISRKTKATFYEACVSFIYGLNLAAISLARSVLESALKENYSFLEGQTLGIIVNEGWTKIDKLRRRPELREKARGIWLAGNQALHEHRKDKVVHTLNELYARSVLLDLKEILEFLYD